MHVQKISKSVTSALTHIGESIEAHDRSDENKVIQLTWHAASDLEYALFLFSLIHKDETHSSPWKLSPSKKPEMKSLLASTQNLLKEAEESLEADNLKKAHEKTWLARGQLLRIHEVYEKKQRMT
jgi:hypothetical protein